MKNLLAAYLERHLQWLESNGKGVKKVNRKTVSRLQRMCSNCGALNDYSRKTCRSCGHKF